PPLRLPPGLAEPLRKADIVGAQEALNALGLDAGTADGIIGSRTRAALRAFQLDAGLPADGYPDPDTLEALERHALP
ncbi:MAG TPA: lytic murein transglycosylase, partial [Halieaceae bacterium]|nr:lytic murein transglycosylase [Halieaceae bacterium]